MPAERSTTTCRFTTGNSRKPPLLRRWAFMAIAQAARTQQFAGVRDIVDFVLRDGIQRSAPAIEVLLVAPNLQGHFVYVLRTGMPI
jgi:hypothetical protein